jgi:hypothetical protein
MQQGSRVPEPQPDKWLSFPIQNHPLRMPDKVKGNKVSTQNTYLGEAYIDFSL